MELPNPFVPSDCAGLGFNFFTYANKNGAAQDWNGYWNLTYIVYMLRRLQPCGAPELRKRTYRADCRL